MPYLLLTINYALMLAMPVAVAALIARKTHASWRYFFIGAATFMASQVFHIPFNIVVLRSGVLSTDFARWTPLVVYALFLGLSAGVFEEGARYLTYRFWAKDARSWSRGLMLGAGHGGIEAILLGLLAAVNLIALFFVLRSEPLMATLPPTAMDQINAQLSDITTQPWPSLLLGAVERAFAIVTHLALSLLVLQVFLRRNVLWLLLAIAYHALFNMAAVIGMVRTGPYTTEGILGLLSLFSVFLIFRLRTPEPVLPEPEAVEVPAPTPSLQLEPTSEALERSRYH